MSVVMALNVSHAADDPAIISNKAPELINSWISANNHRSIETIHTLLDPNASIKITDPVTGTLTQYNREEFLQVFPDMWKESLEYTLSVLDYSIQGNVLVLRVNETSTQAVGTISHNATETFELYEKDVKSVSDLPITTVIPAFMTSELKRAFTIGFLIFIPFLMNLL